MIRIGADIEAARSLKAGDTVQLRINAEPGLRKFTDYAVQSMEFIPGSDGYPLRYPNVLVTLSSEEGTAEVSYVWLV